MSQQDPSPGSFAGIVTALGGVIVTGGALLAAVYPAHATQVVAFAGAIGTLLALIAAWLNHRSTQALHALHAENHAAIASVAQAAGVPAPVEVKTP